MHAHKHMPTYADAKVNVNTRRHKCVYTTCMQTQWNVNMSSVWGDTTSRCQMFAQGLVRHKCEHAFSPEWRFCVATQDTYTVQAGHQHNVGCALIGTTLIITIEVMQCSYQFHEEVCTLLLEHSMIHFI